MNTSFTNNGNTINKYINFNDIDNVDSGISSKSRFQSPPVRQLSQQTFLKTIDTENHVSIPGLHRDKYQDRSLTDSYNIRTEANSHGFSGFPKDQIKMQVEDNFDNSYLIPLDDPPLYTDPNAHFCKGVSQSGSSSSETSTISFHRKGRPSQRVDSGLGDCESIQGSSNVRFTGSHSPSISSISVFNPRLSVQVEQHYEDIDQYNKTNLSCNQKSNHQPQRSSTDKFTVERRSNGLQKLPQCNVSGVTLSDTEDTEPVLHTSMAETISGLMHDPRVGSLPHTYMPLRTNMEHIESKKTSTPTRLSCWLIIVLIMILIISLAALSISIYVLVSVMAADFTERERTPMEHSKTSQTLVRFNLTISNLQQKIDGLMKENEALKEIFLAQQNNLTSYVQEVAQLSFQQQNLSSKLQMVKVNFDDKLTNIKLTPGPQGQPGVVNFSLCVNQSIGRSALSSERETTDTSYMPSEIDLKNYFVTFAYCTYSGAAGAQLESQLSSTSNRHRYRCSCWGTVKGTSRTSCKINIWMCPHGN